MPPVRVDPGAHPQLEVLDELLLDPGQPELGLAVVVLQQSVLTTALHWRDYLEPIPAHHVEDVESVLTLAVDAVQDGVPARPPTLHQQGTMYKTCF